MSKATLKWICAGAGAALLLSGCASTSEQLASSMGRPADQLVQALGEPDADFRLQNGQRVLEWRSWSTRKEPRYYYSAPRMTHGRSGHDAHSAVRESNLPLAQAYDTGHFSVQACVVWVQLDDEGIIERGKAHGSGC